jgi:four helix bundle protein
MGSFRDLAVYKKAFENAMAIYKMPKAFPRSEQFLLTDQIILSSRAVCSYLAEGYRKRQYEKHFVSKICDSDSENTETLVWLDFAVACEYISENEYKKKTEATEEVGRLLG